MHGATGKACLKTGDKDDSKWLIFSNENIGFQQKDFYIMQQSWAVIHVGYAL